MQSRSASDSGDYCPPSFELELPEVPVPEELPEPLLLVSPVDELPLPVDPEVSLAPASEVLLLGVVGPLRPCAFELRLVEPELPGVALEPASESVVP